MLNISNKIREHYNKYFLLFKEHAPPEMLSWGYADGIPNGMASSLESIIAFSELVIKELQPGEFILNAGAGASSWMFRYLYPERVICIDPDVEYLGVVREICKIGGVDASAFVGRLEDVRLPAAYTYWDYGNAIRYKYLSKAIEITKKAIYVDDADTRADCADFRGKVHKLAENKNLIIKDCMEANDEYGRWGVILTKQ